MIARACCRWERAAGVLLAAIGAVVFGARTVQGIPSVLLSFGIFAGCAALLWRAAGPSDMRRYRWRIVVVGTFGWLAALGVAILVGVGDAVFRTLVSGVFGAVAGLAFVAGRPSLAD